MMKFVKFTLFTIIAIVVVLSCKSDDDPVSFAELRDRAEQQVEDDATTSNNSQNISSVIYHLSENFNEDSKSFFAPVWQFAPVSNNTPTLVNLNLMSHPGK